MVYLLLTVIYIHVEFKLQGFIEGAFAGCNTHKGLGGFVVLDFGKIKIYIHIQILPAIEREGDIHRTFFHQDVGEGVFTVKRLQINFSGAKRTCKTAHERLAKLIPNHHDDIVVIVFENFHLELEGNIRQVHIIGRVLIEVIGMICLALDLDGDIFQEVLFVNDGIGSCLFICKIDGVLTEQPPIEPEEEVDIFLPGNSIGRTNLVHDIGAEQLDGGHFIAVRPNGVLGSSQRDAVRQLVGFLLSEAAGIDHALSQICHAAIARFSTPVAIPGN